MVRRQRMDGRQAGGLAQRACPAAAQHGSGPDAPPRSPLYTQVFGRVLADSMLAVRKLEAVATGPNNKPKLPCIITQCGEM